MHDTLSLTFSALADPTRRAMLASLSKGESSVSDLARPFMGQMSLPAITKHLKVLEKARLITRSRHAQWRPCQLHASAMKLAANWIEQYRAYWEESLDRLGEYLQTVTADLDKKPSPPAKKKRSGKLAPPARPTRKKTKGTDHANP